MNEPLRLLRTGSVRLERVDRMDDADSCGDGELSVGAVDCDGVQFGMSLSGSLFWFVYQRRTEVCFLCFLEVSLCAERGAYFFAGRSIRVGQGRHTDGGVLRNN